MNSLWNHTTGPPNAEIVIVGESWGREELFEGKPFVGQSGQELDRMLSEAGLNRADVLCSNVVNKKPPNNELERLFLPYDKNTPALRGLNPPPEIIAEIKRLYEQIEFFPRKLIIAAGNWSLWSLSNVTSFDFKPIAPGVRVRVPTGITSWRSSQIYTDTLSTRTKLLPIVHPAAILREWKWRSTTVQDMRKWRQTLDWEPHPSPEIIIAEEAEKAIGYLEHLLSRLDEGPLRLSNDIETYKKLITVIGFGVGPYDQTGSALVIPLVRALGEEKIESWFKHSEEAQILYLIRLILTHPNARIEGQNYLYDTQYYIKWLGIRPRCDFDTMHSQHLLFPGTPKGLDFLSSLYCRYHRYWKDDGKDWNISGNQHQHLIYNGEDCLRTYECATVQRGLIKHFNLEDQWEFEKEKAILSLDMSLKGIRIDMNLRAKLRKEVFLEQMRIQSRLANLIPSHIIPVPKTSKKAWFESEHQQKTLFFDILGLTPQTHRKTKRPTIGDEALNALEEEHPELSTVFNHLKAERSLGVFRSNFLDAEVDADGRMRSSFGLAETFRWTSSKNVFGSGTNLQNIPVGDEE